MHRTLTLILLASCLGLSSMAQEPPAAPETPVESALPEGMTAEKLGQLILRVDETAETRGNGYVFRVAERDVMVVYDENADRMRIIVPIIPATDLPEGLLMRMLQANFDAVLDARYAVGNGNVWSIFVHPLASLTDNDFLSGLAQTIVAAETFGTTFSSGVLVFGGGDSQNLHEDLLRRLEEATRANERDI